MTATALAMHGSVLGIQICLLWLSARHARDCYSQASGFSLSLKRARDLEAQIADLNSNFESLLESHKRLRSRQGMKDLREKRGTDATRQPETKAQLLARLGLAGKAGPDFARAQLGIHADNQN